MAEPGARLAELIRAESGILLRGAPLEAAQDVACRIAGTADLDDAVDRLAQPLAGRPLLDRLLDEVTVQETFFLRHPEDLRDIDWPGLVDGARARGASTARVWSAACATGEEPYTLAILASEALGSQEGAVSVLGTDVSESALARAREGSYGRRSVGRLPARVLEQHFTRVGDEYRVGDTVRPLVEFRRHNLARDRDVPAPGPFDLILCRNVLIYLEPDAVATAVETLERSLAPDGRLVLGAADRLALPRPAVRRAGGAPVRLATPRRTTRPAARARPAARPRPAATVDEALRLADEGALDEATEVTERLLREDPADVLAGFVAATVRLAAGDPQAAVAHLRSVLYSDPDFALAAFQLGRAHDELGDTAAAGRAYRHALRVIDPSDDRAARLLRQVDLGDVAAACRGRLADIRNATTG